MGGREASRGFLYQAFASVLEAMCQKNWDRIYIEFKSDDDKVDIALEENSKIFKSIQVKSTINTFSKNSLEKWLQDLINDDVGANEFELFLIGQCNNDALTFINSIDKLQKNKLDATAQKSLQGFDTSIIQDRKISFKHIPFDVEILETFGGEPEIIFWQALYLPIVSHGRKTANGFRANPQGWWLRDKSEVLTRKTRLEWIISENWNQQEISQRGKINDFILRKKILLVGAGCVGASIAEILVRSGVYSLTIIDSDIFEVGNLSRHVLNVDDIGGLKGLSLCNYLNSLNPHANVEVINNALTIDGELKTNIDLDKYRIIIDCTGENSVLDIIQSNNFKKRHIFASVSVGLGAKRLYITLMNNQTFDFKAFFDLIAPYLQSERVLYNDYDLPRNGIGCWHPTFPGRSDDVWLAASTATKAIENYIITESEKTISLVYEQRESNGFFEGYMLVDKTEDG